MPYKDNEAKLQRMREWRKERIAQGYGKALYKNRKKRWDNEKRLRQGIQEAISKLHPIRKRHVEIDTAIVILELALKEAPEAKMPMDLMKEDTK